MQPYNSKYCPLVVIVYSKMISLSISDDILALESYTFISLPDEIWGLLPVTVQLSTIIANIGTLDLAADPGGLFRIKLAFSVDDVYDSGDNINTLTYQGAEYLYIDSLMAGDSYNTPTLFGKVIQNVFF